MTEENKHPGGRPLLFNSPEELQIQIDAYFEYCDDNKKPYLVTGLALFLDVDRHTISNYQDRDEFFTTIKKAKDKIMVYAESQLFRNGGQVAGVIFNLKNNWSDHYKDKVFTEDETNYTEQYKRAKEVVEKFKQSIDE